MKRTGKYNEDVPALEAEIERLRKAMQRAADMLPANAACGVLRAALDAPNQYGPGVTNGNG